MFKKNEDQKVGECPIDKIYKSIQEHNKEKTLKKLEDIRRMISSMDTPSTNGNGNGNGNGDHSVSL